LEGISWYNRGESGENMIGIGERIRILRKKRGWTQDQLGEVVGMHGRHIGRYETDKTKPSAKALQKLAEVFEVSVDELLQEHDKPTLETLLKDKELIKLFQEVETLEEKDRMVAKGVLHALVMKKHLQQVLLQNQG
jgi:transcriptional regulator with XRE-family HTH domain